ncbi:MAG: selenide, water dikinase SelD [Deltaproteobacteria bacterium RIFCSPHIGHO2_12_FULL_43_9]|nr:MAG: selenide, water dikinase SelD [Deltaproteobacteria bacterium RIFCSPHIGHO2_12_FULL_43_9]
MVGTEHFDDAGVFQIRDDLALVQTVDFFTPIVDDPFIFGQIAAANALSDIYAMGGRPLTCLNIISFPKDQPAELMGAILAGGENKAREAGALIVGGHSISDEQLSFGMAVTGEINPKRILTNCGAKVGDILILTKPIGTGVLTTARREDRIDDKVLQPALDAMLQLHAPALHLLQTYEINALTDITGFSLLGHAKQMAEASGVSILLDHSRIPLFPEVERLIEAGVTTRANRTNWEYVKSSVTGEEQIPKTRLQALLDPQSSGPLLISIPKKYGDEFVIASKEVGFQYTTIIGHVTELREKTKISLVAH